MGFLDLFGKRDVSAELTRKVPYALTMQFHPYRLSANRNDSVMLKVGIENLSTEPFLTSIVVKVPKKLGLDQTGLQQVREIRLGELTKDESKTVSVEIYGSTKTDEGEYPIEVTAMAHYRNYAYVLNSEKKKASLRAV
jgi:uncharacterized membrane protein